MSVYMCKFLHELLLSVFNLFWFSLEDPLSTELPEFFSGTLIIGTDFYYVVNSSTP